MIGDYLTRAGWTHNGVSWSRSNNVPSAPNVVSAVICESLELAVRNQIEREEAAE